jgi:hypothetical protein
MTAEDFEQYLRQSGLEVETITGADGGEYIVVRSLAVPTGGLKGQSCDVAIRREVSVPYVVPAAIHTYPALVPMGGEPLATSPSPIGDGWQYWSRRFERPATPQSLWAHVLTILCDDRWSTN